MSLGTPEAAPPPRPPGDRVEGFVAAPPASRRPFTSLASLVLFIVFCGAGLLVSPLLVTAGYATLKPFFHWPASARSLAQNTFFQLLAQAVFYLFLVSYVYLVVVGYYRLPFWRGIGWKAPTREQAARSILTGIALTLAVALLSLRMPDRGEFPLEKMFSSPAAAYAIAAFAILIAPLMEELIFRGILFSFFEAKAGAGAAVVSTAVLFAAFHIQEYWGAWHHLILILVVGLTLSVTRAVTGWLTPSVIVHMTYNACLMAGLYVGTHRFHNLPQVMGS